MSVFLSIFAQSFRKLIEYNNMEKNFKPETLCVQGGWQPKKGEPRVLPIYQSTTFKYETSEQMARLFDLEDSGYFYTRLQNPTNDAVEKIAYCQLIRQCYFYTFGNSIFQFV